jgi:hypothetical protein
MARNGEFRRMLGGSSAVLLLLMTGCGSDPSSTRPTEVRSVSLSAPQTVQITYSRFSEGTDLGPQDGVFDVQAPPSGNSFLVNNNGWSSIRTVLEFDLSGIPEGSTVESAELSFAMGAMEGPRYGAVHGFADDGSIGLDDFQRGSLTGTFLVPANAVVPVSMDATSLVRSALGGDPPFVGFNFREEPANAANYIVMVLAAVPPATLTIQYRAPELLSLAVESLTIESGRDHRSDMVQLAAEFQCPVPLPSGIVGIFIDGSRLVSQPLSSFSRVGRTSTYVSIRKGAMTWIDFAHGELYLIAPKVDLDGLDTTDGVTVRLQIGDASGEETIVLRAMGRHGLTYRRPH